MVSNTRKETWVRFVCEDCGEPFYVRIPSPVAQGVYQVKCYYCFNHYMGSAEE